MVCLSHFGNAFFGGYFMKHDNVLQQQSGRHLLRKFVWHKLCYLFVNFKHALNHMNPYYTRNCLEIQDMESFFKKQAYRKPLCNIRLSDN